MIDLDRGLLNRSVQVCPFYFTCIFYKTLSKILCKWKQDSVISSFLYLDSVFKDKHKLVHNQAPV